MDIEAEVLQTVDEALDVPSRGALVEVIGTEILVAGSVLEHVIDGGEQRGSDRANGFLGSAGGRAGDDTAPESSCLWCGPLPRRIGSGPSSARVPPSSCGWSGVCRHFHRCVDIARSRRSDNLRFQNNSYPFRSRSRSHAPQAE